MGMTRIFARGRAGFVRRVLVVCLLACCVPLFCYGGSKEEVASKDANAGKSFSVLWSPNDKWALVFVTRADGRYNLWLADGYLDPQRHLAGPQLCPKNAACFSRDSTRVFYQTVRNRLLHSHRIVWTATDGNSKGRGPRLKMGDVAIGLMPGEGDQLLVYRSGDNIRRIFCWLPNEKRERCILGPEQGVRGFFRFPSPEVRSTAHNDCVVDGSARIVEMRGETEDLWTIPLTGAKAPSRKELKTDTLVFASSSDESITARYAWESSGTTSTGSSPTIEQIMAQQMMRVGEPLDELHFSGGKVLGPLRTRDYRLDRTGVAVLDEKSGRLCLYDGRGRETELLGAVPERGMRVMSLNESLGVVCLEGEKRICVYDYKNKRMMEREKGLFEEGRGR